MLPINEYETAIVSAVNDNNVVIIRAETGAGKSTQVPRFLHNAGYDVVMTEPRRLAARSVAQRIAGEMNVELGDIVGFQTGMEQKKSSATEILVCTDGLQLIRTLTEEYDGHKPRVLIIDEVHEWNLNIEVLIAWCRRRLSLGWKTKIVIMSATMETVALQEYFDNNAVVIDVPGKIFPVSYQQTEDSILSNIHDKSLEGKNILVFLPGKREIEELAEKIGSNAEVIPLYGDLLPEEQQRVFGHYPRPKVILSTNIAQTSITIDDVDVVIDSGLERRIEVLNGIEGLFLRNISRSDCLQRKGRAGRTKPGEYILCSSVGIDERNEFPIPEIRRSILDQVVLRLAVAGMDISELVFYHQPDSHEIEVAKTTLRDLGAMTEDDKITSIGFKMAKMPMGARTARMVVEANELGVVDDVIVIAAIMEMGGLINHRSGNNYRSFCKEEESDILAEFEIWKQILVDPNMFGINKKAFYRVREFVNKCHDSLRGLVDFGSTGNRADIIRAYLSGMVDKMYWHGYTGYTQDNEHSRSLDRKSCVNYPQFVVGIPKTIHYKDRYYGGDRCLELLCMVTKVTAETVKELAPHLFSTKTTYDAYNEFTDSLIVNECLLYRGVECESSFTVLKEGEEFESRKKIYFEKKREEEEKKRQLFEQQRRERVDSIRIDGVEVKTENGGDGVYVTFNRDQLFRIKEIEIPEGGKVKFRCEFCSSYSIEDLKDAVEKADIRKQWEKTYDKSRRHDQTQDLSKVAFWYQLKLGKQQIVTPIRPENTHCYNCDGYVAVSYLSYTKKFYLRLCETEEEYLEQMKTSLEVFWPRYIEENTSGLFGENLELFQLLLADFPPITAENVGELLQHLNGILMELQ